MRLFVAIDLKELEPYFEGLKRALMEDGLSLASGAHLTLTFIGEASEAEKQRMAEKLAAVAFTPFSLATTTVGFFPNERAPRVVWLGVEPSEPLLKLQDEVRHVLAQFGIRDDHPFHPHITLARVKFLQNRERFIEKAKKVCPEKMTTLVSSLLLVKSTLTPKGPMYEELLRVKAR